MAAVQTKVRAGRKPPPVPVITAAKAPRRAARPAPALDDLGAPFPSPKNLPPDAVGFIVTRRTGTNAEWWQACHRDGKLWEPGLRAVSRKQMAGGLRECGLQLAEDNSFTRRKPPLPVGISEAATREVMDAIVADPEAPAASVLRWNPTPRLLALEAEGKNPPRSVLKLAGLLADVDKLNRPDPTRGSWGSPEQEDAAGNRMCAVQDRLLTALVGAEPNSHDEAVLRLRAAESALGDAFRPHGYPHSELLWRLLVTAHDDVASRLSAGPHATPPTCRLAIMAQRSVEIEDRLDELSRRGIEIHHMPEGSSKNFARRDCDREQATLLGEAAALEDLAPFIEARTATGAFYALALANHQATDIIDHELTRKETDKAAEMVSRLLFSALHGFATALGIETPRHIVQNWMTDYLDPFRYDVQRDDIEGVVEGVLPDGTPAYQPAAAGPPA